MGVGPLEAEQDVGGDRDEFEAGEEKHEVVGHAHERQAGEQQEERARLLAGAAATDAAGRG